MATEKGTGQGHRFPMRGGAMSLRAFSRYTTLPALLGVDQPRSSLNLGFYGGFITLDD